MGFGKITLISEWVAETGLLVAFPLAAAMLKKGARVANMIVFLTAWACIKLPQEMVELQFMGLEFTLLRFSLTAVAAVLMGLLTEKLMKTGETTQESP